MGNAITYCMIDSVKQSRCINRFACTEDAAQLLLGEHGKTLFVLSRSAANVNVRDDIAFMEAKVLRNITQHY